MSFVIGELTARVDANTSPFNQRLNQLNRDGNTFGSNFSKSLKSIGSDMQDLGGKLTKSVTLPLLAAGIAVVKLGGDFERELSKVTGLVGISEKQVSQWGNQILKLGPQIGQAPKALAEALFYVTSAGLRGAEAMDVLTLSGKAASAGLGETAVVADLVTSAMNAYGPKNLSAAKATDILVAAVREGKAAAADLAGSMGAVLPLASELGVEFEEVAATQAAMTRTGTDASEAATQLKGIMASLLKPTKEANDTLKKMGTSASEMRKKIKEDGLLNTLIELRESTKKYGEETVAKVFPNIRALMGILDLMGANLEDNKKVFENVANSTGMLDEAFKAASETLDFKFDQSLSQIKSTAIEFFDVLKGALLPILNTFNKVVSFIGDKFKNLSKPMQTGILAFTALSAIMPLIILAFGNLIGVAAGVASAISTIASIISTIGAPTLIVIGAIASLIGILGTLVLSSETVRSSIINKFKEIGDKIKKTVEFIIEHIDDIKKAIKGFAEGLDTGNFANFTAAMIEMIPDKFRDNLINAVTKLILFREKVLEIRDKIFDFASTVKDVAEPTINALKEALSNIDWASFKESLDLAKQSLEPLIPVLQNLGKIIGFVFVNSLGIMISLFGALLSIIPNVIGIIVSLGTIVRSVFKIIMGILTLNGDLIQKGFEEMWAAVINVWKNAFSLIKNFIGNFFKIAVTYFKNLYKKIGNGIVPELISKVINFFKDLNTKVTLAIINMVISVIKKIRNFKDDFVKWIKSAVKNGVIAFGGFISKVIIEAAKLYTAGKEAAGKLLKGITKIDFKEAGKNVVQSVIDGITSMFRSLGNTAAGIGSIISSYLPHSPAKMGALKNLDKLNFKDPILKSLNNAKDAIMNDWLGKIVINGPENSKLETASISSGTNISGTFIFNGVQNIENFMSEMNNTVKRYGGRIFE